MNAVRQDQVFFREAAAVLKEYLLGEPLFWPITGLPARGAEFQLDRLTPGNLRLVQARLAARGCPMDDLNAQVTAVTAEWQTAWRRKCSQEWTRRLADWMSFLDEALRPGGVHAQEYHFKVRWRVILELIRADAALGGALGGALTAVDQRLATRFQPGDFIWDPELAPAFPAPQFWFLYGNLTIARQS